MQAYLSMNKGATKPGSFTASFGLRPSAPPPPPKAGAGAKKSEPSQGRAKKAPTTVPPQPTPPEIEAAIAANWKEPPPEFVASLTDKERIVLGIAQRVQAGFFDVTATQIYVAWKEKQDAFDSAILTDTK